MTSATKKSPPKKSPSKKAPVKKAALKKPVATKPVENDLKSFLNLQNHNKEFMLLMDEYLTKAKSGFHHPRVYDELKATLSEIKHALKKIRKHVSGANPVKAK